MRPLQICLLILFLLVAACGGGNAQPPTVAAPAVAPAVGEAPTAPPTMTEAAPAQDDSGSTGEMPPPPAPETDEGVPGGGEIARPPAGLAAYQHYLQVVGERSGPSTDLAVEATVLSLSQSEVCPYPEETCPIAPYPNDWGRVRIDAVTLGGGEASSEGGASGGDEGRTTAPNEGSGLPGGQKEAGPLQPGQEVQAQFLLTVQPVTVRYAPAPAESGGLESGGAPGPQAPPTYEPLPRENGRLVFTIGTAPGAEAQSDALPGLAPGDRFRARARYDGVLRVQTYERLP